MSETDELQLVGAVLAGRYRIVRRLGEGGMGAVYLGEHVSLLQKRAIKVLHEKGTTPSNLARFMRGSRNAARIDHPNVCRVFDYGDPPGGLHFLAMEFIEGESLEDVISRVGRVSPDRAMSIIGQTADALGAAHDLGIVHRDVKPANIMLTRGHQGEELVKVVDFDIAKGPETPEDSGLTGPGWMIGTPDYMSPEQFMGGSVDARSDIYSLGLVLFRMLTGERPWPPETGAKILYQRLNDPHRTLTEVCPEQDFPGGIQAVIDRTLQPKPEDRWPTAGAFARALEDAYRGGDAHASDDPGTVLAPSRGDLATRVAPARGPDATMSASAPSAIGGPSRTLDVGSAPAHPGVESPKPPRGRIALAAGGGLALVAIALVLWNVTGLGGGGTASPPGAAPGETSGAVALDPGTSVGSPQDDVSSRGASDPSTPSGADSGPGDVGDLAAGGGGPAGTADAGTPPGSPTADAEGTATGIATSDSDASARLDQFGQEFVRLSGLGAVPDEVAREAEAEAAAIWADEGHSTLVRAQAADIRARAHAYLEDYTEARRWAEEATVLDPDNLLYRARLAMPAGPPGN